MAGVLASLGLGLPETSAPARGPSPALATPLWSLRRYPLPITTAVKDAVEQRTVTETLTRYVARFERSCFVVRRGDELIAASEPDTALLPASTEKLLTATAALDILGPEFRYTTNVVAAGAPVAGVVERLWMVGAGDPSLSTEPYADRGVSTSMEALADSVVASGTRRVTAGIAVDDFRYDGERAAPSWPGTYITKFETGPLGALTANHGIPLVNGKPVTVADPGLYAAAELTALLRARGVVVGGEPTRSAAPAGAATMGSVTSVPLRTLIAFTLQISDNLAAELLTKELGVRTVGSGTTAAGTAATMAVMSRLGMPTAGVVMVDGSGLDRGNRLTCRALAARRGACARTRAAVTRGVASGGRYQEPACRGESWRRAAISPTSSDWLGCSTAIATTSSRSSPTAGSRRGRSTTSTDLPKRS